jgi:uncharacterized membrane protein YraQ (UPF0718 family)
VPAELIAGAVGGDGLMPIVLSAVVGIPAYLNGYVVPPLLAGLTAQGMSAGAAMAAVWSLVKPSIFASYLLLGLFGAILWGIVFQLLA